MVNGSLSVVAWGNKLGNWIEKGHEITVGSNESILYLDCPGLHKFIQTRWNAHLVHIVAYHLFFNKVDLKISPTYCVYDLKTRLLTPGISGFCSFHCTEIILLNVTNTVLVVSTFLKFLFFWFLRGKWLI